VTNQSDAFLSYTRLDDEFFGGAITSLRKLLELGVQVVTGHKNFNIFQDIDGIEFGQQWQKRLDQAIVSTRFLIPIITPLFFQSNACRDELTKFIAHEKKHKRDDLVLPIYFVTAPVLERPEMLRDDSVATAISIRQRYDWRSKAALPINDPQMRGAVMELSEKIASAIARAPLSFKTASPGKVTPSKKKMTAPAARRARVSAFRRASAAVSREEPRKKTKGQRKILWVDDRPDNNIFERKAMQSYNIKFELAESTGKALAKLKKTKFDAIISDMGRPPDMQAGYTLLDALRGSGDSTPFFIYAGSDSAEHRRLALKRGAQGSTNRSDKLITSVLKSLDG
jgi:CheY-like chemotaxis protein